MSIVLFVLCIIFIVIIFLQNLFEITITFFKSPIFLIPFTIIFLISIVTSIRDIKKNGFVIPRKRTKKELLYSILDNLSGYHKVITDNKIIDLILITESGIIAFNFLNIEGVIEKLDSGDLYYKRKGGKEGKINNFIEEIKKEISNISSIINYEKIDKVLIRDKEIIFKNNFAEGFEIKHISRIFYDVEKRKEKIFNGEEIDRIYELIRDGNNKN